MRSLKKAGSRQFLAYHHNGNIGRIRKIYILGNSYMRCPFDMDLGVRFGEADGRKFILLFDYDIVFISDIHDRETKKLYTREYVNDNYRGAGENFLYLLSNQEGITI